VTGVKTILSLLATLLLAPLGVLHSANFIPTPEHLAAQEVLDLGQRRELFVDDHLIDQMQDLELRLAAPLPVPLSEAPPPRSSVYSTIIEANGIYHYYTRGNVHSGERKDIYQHAYFYYRSRDGLHWEKPELNLFPKHGAAHSNMILEPRDAITHNFSPFYDTRPGVAAEERFKGLGGGGKTWSTDSGLHALASADGIHWRMMREAPVIPEGKTSEHYFDSQPVVFWSEVEKLYVCYFRTWLPKVEGRRGVRSFSRSTSKDFIYWTEAVQQPHPNTDEQIYTNPAFSYFRAPHIYLAFPLRYLPWAGGDIHRYSSDVVLLSARAGGDFERTFEEAFIRPGRDPQRWRWPNPISSSLTLGMIQTAEDELSLYIQDQRYTLRLDGFASLHAGGAYGEMTTRRLRFDGTRMEINLATSAAGRIHIAILDADGGAIPGFGHEDMAPIVGDEIARTVTRKNKPDLAVLRGRVVRLHFKMRDADLYALQFK